MWDRGSRRRARTVQSARPMASRAHAFTQGQGDATNRRRRGDRDAYEERAEWRGSAGSPQKLRNPVRWQTIATGARSESTRRAVVAGAAAEEGAEQAQGGRGRGDAEAVWRTDAPGEHDEGAELAGADRARSGARCSCRRRAPPRGCRRAWWTTNTTSRASRMRWWSSRRTGSRRHRRTSHARTVSSGSRHSDRGRSMASHRDSVFSTRNRASPLLSLKRPLSPAEDNPDSKRSRLHRRDSSPCRRRGRRRSFPHAARVALARDVRPVPASPPLPAVFLPCPRPVGAAGLAAAHMVAPIAAADRDAHADVVHAVARADRALA